MGKTNVAAEMQLARFAQKTNGLRMTEMHLRVLGLMDQTDKYTLLGLIEDMMDEVGRNGVRALGQNIQNLSKRQAMLLLSDLRQWFVTDYCNDVVENCNRVRDLRRRAEAQEAELTSMKARLGDGWTDRVTYDNMVEQIAACEDPRERDDARKLIETMLKRDKARKFREDIRCKVLENQGAKGLTVNNYVTLNNARFDGPMNEITGNDNVHLGGYGN